MWDLVPDQESNPGPLHWERSLSHWATREVPVLTSVIITENDC